MFGLGLPELLILLVVVLIFFGGKRLPQLGSALGRSMQNFKKGLKDESSDEDGDHNASEKPHVEKNEEK